MLAIGKTLKRASDQRGFTLVEVTIILLVLVILSTIMLPQLGNFNRLARFVKVKEDLGAICATLKKFLDEVMVPGPFNQPGGSTAAPTDRIGLLVGPGRVPALAASVDTAAENNTTAGTWANAAPNATTADLSVPPDIGTTTAQEFKSDLLENHLQINDPFADGSATSTFRYKNQVDSSGVGAFFGWRGPYFDEITEDPWGTRYAVNAFGLHISANGGTYSTPVICYSVGPDTTADTKLNMPHPNGYVLGGDDIAVVLSAMGPF